MTAGQGIRGANHGSQCPLTPPPDSPRPPGANLQGEASRPTSSDRSRHPIRAWGSRGHGLNYKVCRPSRKRSSRRHSSRLTSSHRRCRRCSARLTGPALPRTCGIMPLVPVGTACSAGCARRGPGPGRLAAQRLAGPSPQFCLNRSPQFPEGHHGQRSAHVDIAGSVPRPDRRSRCHLLLHFEWGCTAACRASGDAPTLAYPRNSTAAVATRPRRTRRTPRPPRWGW